MKLQLKNNNFLVISVIILLLIILSASIYGININGFFTNAKLEYSIKNSGFSERSINNDGTVSLLIFFNDDVSEDKIKEVSNRYGEFISKESAGSGYILHVKENSILDLLNEGVVRFVEEVGPPPTEYNDGTRIALDINNIQSSPYQLDGTDISLGIWDSGFVDGNHDDFGDRVAYADTSTIKSHPTHVAGTMAGDGTLSFSNGGTAYQWKGVATNANITSYNWTDPVIEHNGAINVYGIKVSQNSWGDEIDNSTCSYFGSYLSRETDYDDIVRGDEYGEPVTIVFAAGNERNDGDCNLPNNPYNSTTRPSTAKNVISVGAVYSDTIGMTDFSGWGPTDDGRIKPDVVAPGSQKGGDTGIKSTYPGDSYTVYNGTSMAAPAVSGIAGLMYQQFDCLKPYNVEKPLPSTIKALLIHTAKDLNRTGPDYITGWGLINATEAIDYIIYRYFREDNLSSVTDLDRYNFTINDSTKAVKVTLVWDDVGGKDSDSDHLKNDLDLYLKAPNGTIFKSWTLDPTNPSNPATKDGNHRDNVEQVYVPNPGSANLFNKGQWQIIVNATSCSQCPQKYSLIYKRPFLLRLQSDWNGISFPVIPYDKTIGGIIANNSNITKIYYFNSSWQTWTKGVACTSNCLTTIEQGMGPHIKCNASTTLEVNGDPITKNSASSTTPLDFSEGIWYTAGYNSFFEIPTNESLNDLDFISIWRYKGKEYDYDNIKDNYKIYYNNGTFENAEFNFKPGLGAWIKMNSADTWTIPQIRSCPSVPTTIETFSTQGAETTNQPFVIYGYGICDQELNKLNTDVVIRLRVNGTEITNYTMGDVAVNQYRLQVPVGAGVETGNIAEILINNATIAEGNVTIGSSGAFYYLNISASQTTDSDGDGFSCQCLDCNDNNASINPNAAEICVNNVDDNCNNLVDESCGLEVLNLSAVYSNGRERIFEFKINNTGTSTVNGISWRLNTGESVINSTQTFNLEGNKSAFVYVYYNYSKDGAYNVNASVSCVSLNDYATTSVYVGDLLSVTNLSVLNSNRKAKILEFIINNKANGTLNNIMWSLNTGLETINDSETINLPANKTAFVYANYNYTNTGTYTVNASTTADGLTDSDTISVEVKGLTVDDLQALYSDSLYRIFEFSIYNNINSDIKNISWSFRTGSGAIINNSQNISLQSNEGGFVYVAYNYSSAGTYTANATARNATKQDWEDIPVIIS